MEEPAKGLLANAPLIPSWSSNPVPYLSLSAGGLLALADLNTVARRTAIAGGSSWLDALILAPGLHYQQAADALDQEDRPGSLGAIAAVEETRRDGGTEVTRYTINNVATVNFLRRLCSDSKGEGGTITVNVGIASSSQNGDDDAGRTPRRGAVQMLIRRRARGRRPRRQGPAQRGAGQVSELDCLSHVFYLLSPVLTVAAITLMTLLADWWGLAFILALMISRMLNIYTIRKRSRPVSPPPPPPSPLPSSSSSSGFVALPDNRPTEYTIEFGTGAAQRKIVLRGRRADLQAVTTQAWLRERTTADGYLEAASKLIVYMVAAFSGNLTQAGAMVLMALLLLSAGLLGLSNAHIRRDLRVHGRRVARPERRENNRGGKNMRGDKGHDGDGDWDDGDLEQGRRDGFPVEDIRGS